MQSLRERSTDPLAQEGASPSLQSTLESYVHDPLSPPERYPVPDTGLHGGANHSDFPFNYQNIAVEDKKELLVVARNSLELLSSILNTETDPKPLKVFLTSYWKGILFLRIIIFSKLFMLIIFLLS